MSVPVQEILDVICRTLSISAKNIVSGACLSTALPSSGPRATRKAGWGLRLPNDVVPEDNRSFLLSKCHCSLCLSWHTCMPEWIHTHTGATLVADTSLGGAELGVSGIIAESFSHPSPHPPLRVCFRRWGFDVRRAGVGCGFLTCVHTRI